jgi:hypothetical protein
MKKSFNIGLVEVESCTISKNNICDYNIVMCFHPKHMATTRNFLDIHFNDLVNLFLLITRCFLIIHFGESKKKCVASMKCFLTIHLGNIDKK